MKTPVPQDSATVINNVGADNYQDKINEKKRIIFTMNGYHNITIVLEGFWDGKLIRAATNAIEKHYRLQRHRMLRTMHAEKLKEEIKNDTGK